MKNIYSFKYAWGDIWHSTNRPFTLINIIAIVVSVTTLVLLLGGLLAFRKSSNERIGELGLRIEINAHEESKITNKEKENLANLKNTQQIYWWKPTLFLFYNAEGHLFDGIGGRTVDVDDPLLKNLPDVRDKKKVYFLSKEKIKNTVLDEVGIIIPFIMLKQLSYLPSSAKISQEKTWRHIPFPPTLSIRIKERGIGGKAMDIALPIIGVIDGKTSGRYLVTKDCYELLGINWNEKWKALLKKRNGTSLFPNAVQNKQTLALTISADTHASMYVSKRDFLLPTLQKIRGMQLRASSPLEFHIQDYEQQETFFIVAAGGICLALFLFTGVILFATFYALTLRKIKEIGILKACGASSWLINKIFILEAVTMGFIAISLGVTIGLFLGKEMSQYVQEELQIAASSLFFMPNEFIGAIFVGGVLFCLLVTFIPVRMAVKVDPDSVIRGH